jgi:hypothetical protein
MVTQIQTSHKETAPLDHREGVMVGGEDIPREKGSGPNWTNWGL